MIGVLHQRLSLVPCCQSKQYGWEWRRTVRLGRYEYMLAVAGAVDAYCGGSCVRIREQWKPYVKLSLPLLKMFIADF